MQHERNIIHANIRLENIIIMDEEMHMKLAGFGNAMEVKERVSAPGR
jgi:serine/threonine protein kinase